MVRKSFFTVISLLILFALQSSAQTVDEIIEKNLEARGGLEKIKAVKSLRMTGRMVAQGQDMPFPSKWNALAKCVSNSPCKENLPFRLTMAKPAGW